MFKNYTSNDNLLLPPCLGDFIPQNDPVRVVHRIIEQINLEELYRKYSPKGCSAYHPRMMLQILVYAYLRNIYSSRRIEEFCRNDIRFMWLTGNVTPDHQGQACRPHGRPFPCGEDVRRVGGHPALVSGRAAPVGADSSLVTMPFFS